MHRAVGSGPYSSLAAGFVVLRYERVLKQWRQLLPRRLVSVRGIVQGVGFRPFAYELACRFGLGGFVRNQSGCVLIEIEGDALALDGFVSELVSRPPPLARIDEVSWISGAARGERAFSIEPSDEAVTDGGFVSPDIATCDQCLAELFNPADRRFQYPFLNCTNCGPRFTIVVAVPYDRQRTSMAEFWMCRDCRREYEGPDDRRFHAQPIACPQCGPCLLVHDARGAPIVTDDAIEYAAQSLAAWGKIGALKGLGGYHLACDATNEMAVTALRERKHRDAKPLAIMVGDVAAARGICEVSAEEEALLTSPAAPIVLLRKGLGNTVAAGVAPRNPCLGVMLPYTPFHHLLMRTLNGVPLAMTSGNSSDEPILYEDADARQRLSGTADFFVAYNRPIHARCDDSVTRIVAGQPLPVRRSRGYVPEPISLPVPCSRPILAVGGQLKSTFALGRGRHAFLSQHLGDLDHYEAYQAYGAAIRHYEQLFAIEPELLVHDLHPDYASTRYAAQRGSSPQLLAVQHHHAHLASCLAENGLDERVIGVIFDGAGLGDDGAIWGGEFLIGDYRGYRRAAHLRYVLMPGGEQAIREPWRMAVSHVIDAGLDCGWLGGDVPPRAINTVRQMLARRFNTHQTSSVGRLFDAVAAMARVCSRAGYEGQAAMELEGLAADAEPNGWYLFEIQPSGEGDGPLLIDTRRLIAAVAEDVRRGCPAGMIARRFHSTVVEMVVQVCKRLGEQTQLDAVALSGGVFMNALLLSESVRRLTDHGFRVYRHRHVPPNDGGLSLGQLAIAAAAQKRHNSGAAV